MHFVLPKLQCVNSTFSDGQTRCYFVANSKKMFAVHFIVEKIIKIKAAHIILYVSQIPTEVFLPCRRGKNINKIPWQAGSDGPIQLKVGDIGGLQLEKVDRFCIFEDRLFSNDISGTTGPRKIVYLSKIAEFYEINNCNTLLLICSLFKSLKLEDAFSLLKQL